MEYCHVKLDLQDVKSLELRVSPEKDEWKHQLLFRLDSCCFQRWFYTNTKFEQNKNQKPKKEKKNLLEHNELLLFRYASTSQHLVVLNRKVEKNAAICQEVKPATFGDLPCTPSSFLIPAEDREEQQHQNQSVPRIQGSFCSSCPN